MFLVQVLLPLYDNDGHRFSYEAFASVRRELTDRFGGATAYTRAPAEGTWEDPGGRIHHDDVVVIEVMTEALDRPWWSRYRKELAARFRQDEIVARAMGIEPL
jgi:hypothetical protein